MSARYAVDGGVAVITIDNPPVNSLSAPTLRDIVAGLDAAEADAAVDAIVIIGGGRMFSAGADITELGAPGASDEPTLWTTLDAIESSEKPVIAAMHGAALGGGLELALAAHYRIASRNTSVGLPEVKIGILPGAGGTQRLPRAVGLETALNMILSGGPVACDSLSRTRLFDRVTDEDLPTFACAFARSAAARGGPHPRVRDWSMMEPNAQPLLELARLGIGDSRQAQAARRCVDALEAAVGKPFEEGLALELEAFSALTQTPESKSLRHIFFAERAARRIDGVTPDISGRASERVAVIGAGTMGTGIAMCFLDAGIPVTLIELKRDALERAVEAIRSKYESGIRKGRLSAGQVQQRMQALRPGVDMADAATAGMVIEAVYEDYSAKEAVFRRLDAVAKPGAILASNTSTLDIDRIAGFTSRPRDVLGMHFFSPANVMRLLELVRGSHTAPEVLKSAMDVATKIGKIAVVAKVCDGFIGNRMLEQYARQAGFLLDEGLSPQRIDQAIERFGFAMGPFRMNDLAGNDISWAIRKRRRQEKPEFTYSGAGDLICELGRFGQKCAAGWYDYEPGDRTAYPSKEVESVLAAHVARLGLPARRIEDREIVERLVFALVNEGATLLEEGIAARGSDIDLVYLNGYGFPKSRGGPMFYADTIGPYNVVRKIRRFARGYRGESWSPAPLLCRLAESGGRFN